MTGCCGTEPAEEGARVAVCGRDPHRLAATEQRLRDAAPAWLCRT
jgi:hypothetical protein